MALISIIVPFYNASKTIKSTLQSIQNQTFKDFECLLINDSSIDDSIKIVEKFFSKDKRFKLFFNTNKGVVYARNLGIKKAIGRYITFLDSDDIWDPYFLEETLNIREDLNRSIPITHSQYYRFEIKNKIIKSNLIKPPQIINYRNILRKNYLPLLTVSIDREITNDILFENIRPEDYHLWIKLIFKIL